MAMAQNLPIKTYVKETWIAVGFCFILFVAMIWAFGHALDTYIDNQNTMLCNSAQESGNMEWQKLCAVYYRTGEIEYLRGVK
jgi:hypothetical protein